MVHLSAIGLGIGLALLPNALWVVLPPTTPAMPASQGRFSALRGRLEALGRVMCFVLPPITQFTFQGAQGVATACAMAASLLISPMVFLAFAAWGLSAGIGRCEL